MPRITGSWLSGPSAALPENSDGAEQAYRGQNLGLPPNGPGSIPGPGRRIGGLMIDWFLSMGVATLITGADIPFGGLMPTMTLIVWFVMGVVCVTLFSYTPGQLFLGMRVGRIDAPARVGFVRALGRQALLSFVVPATITDIDGRGMHDRATGVAMIRTR
ncbi:RDD family protein [Rhodococcus rhodnii]|uniref:RDD domain-containing protein n=2 Tax=Rhodococcus rhodnii TaxID=38312 RepID=R7WL48_9NOCA|nr:RDD family protein [Rhodococcus rhodnii]EOM76041.1 hypothetical protein Rrhod_2568 [Rhodococcus rhodnii LMG 5362]TXG91449.1 RDD family protein [Rhodococcus rhodnii]